MCGIRVRLLEQESTLGFFFILGLLSTAVHFFSILWFGPLKQNVVKLFLRTTKKLTRRQ